MSLDGVTPDRARAELDAAAAVRVERPHDRGRFAAVVAGLGILIGGYVFGDHALDGVEPWSTVLTCAVLAGLLFVVLSQVRGATTPRGATAAGWWGLGTSLTLTFVADWAVRAGLVEGYGPLAATALAVAVPLLVAAAVIARGGRR